MEKGDAHLNKYDFDAAIAAYSEAIRSEDKAGEDFAKAKELGYIRGKEAPR
jgi:hypothetical protein